MRSLLQFLIDTWPTRYGKRLPATSDQMTLHDAIRLCTGRVRIGQKPIVPQTARWLSAPTRLAPSLKPALHAAHK